MARKKQSTAPRVQVADPRDNNSGPFENGSWTNFGDYDVGPSTPENIEEKFETGSKSAEDWMMEVMDDCKEMTVLCVLVKQGKINVLANDEETDFWTWFGICDNGDGALMDPTQDLTLPNLQLLNVHTAWARFAVVVAHQLNGAEGVSWPTDLQGKAKLDLCLKLRLINVVSGLFYKSVADGELAEMSDVIAEDYTREMNWDAERTFLGNSQLLTPDPPADHP